MLAARFFAPLAGISDRCPAARSCPELPDPAWLHLGITRVLEDEPSGRAFLQSLGAFLQSLGNDNKRTDLF